MHLQISNTGHSLQHVVYGYSAFLSIAGDYAKFCELVSDKDNRIIFILTEMFVWSILHTSSLLIHACIHLRAWSDGLPSPIWLFGTEYMTNCQLMRFFTALAWYSVKMPTEKSPGKIGPPEIRLREKWSARNSKGRKKSTKAGKRSTSVNLICCNMCTSTQSTQHFVSSVTCNNS